MGKGKHLILPDPPSQIKETMRAQKTEIHPSFPMSMLSSDAAPPPLDDEALSYLSKCGELLLSLGRS